MLKKCWIICKICKICTKHNHKYAKICKTMQDMKKNMQEMQHNGKMQVCNENAKKCKICKLFDSKCYMQNMHSQLCWCLVLVMTQPNDIVTALKQGPSQALLVQLVIIPQVSKISSANRGTNISDYIFWALLYVLKHY